MDQGDRSTWANPMRAHEVIRELEERFSREKAGTEAVPVDGREPLDPLRGSSEPPD
jgi:hypothetical protein